VNVWFLLLPQLLHLFFASNSIVFDDRGRKIIPFPRAQGILATPLYIVQLMLRNNVLFLEKAAEEYSPAAHRHWGRIITHIAVI